MPDNDQLPLRDIHLPDPIGWWPPAPGWWAVALTVLALAALLAYLIRRPRRPKVFRLASRELDALAAAESMPEAEKVRRLSVLLRRVCLTVYPREQVAGLAGPAWLAWLDQPLKSRPFSEGPGRLLTEAPYRRVSEGDFEALLKLCREWARTVEKAKPRGNSP